MKTIEVFNYCAVTGLFIGVDVAYQSPVKKNSYLIPAHSTDVDPRRLLCPDDSQLAYLDETGKPADDYLLGQWKPVKKDIIAKTRMESSETVTEDFVKQEVIKRLTEADHIFNKLDDLGLETTNVRKYRIELRKVNHQEGYPTNVEWPVIVFTDEQANVLGFN